MSTKFIYSETLPEEILPTLKTKLSKYEDLIPGWVQEIRVFWNSNPEVAGDKFISGQSLGNFPYRWATITICPGFLDEADSDRDDTLIHELVHIILCPLTDFYDQLMHYFDDQPDKVKSFVSGQFTERSEGVTVDLTAALLRTLRGKENDANKKVGVKMPSSKKQSPVQGSD